MTYFSVGCEVDISTWRVKRTGIFIDQPPSYVNFGDEHKVHKLNIKKTLYGLKQTLRVWYSHIEAYFSTKDFKKYSYEHTFLKKLEMEEKCLLFAYM